MLRATHLSVGVAAALAVLQPDNLFEDSFAAFS